MKGPLRRRWRALVPAVLAAMPVVPPALCAQAAGNVPGPPNGLVATLPFEEHQFSLVFLRLDTGGGNLAWFLVDTGTRGCVVDVRQENALHPAGDPAPHSGQRADGAAREKQLSVFFPGGGALLCRPVTMGDLAPATDIVGHPVEGVLGSALFERYVVRIDYAARVVRLYEPAQFAYGGNGHAARLTLDGGIPAIEAEIRDGPGRPVRRRFVVQTGSGDAVNDSAVLVSTTLPRYRAAAGTPHSRDSILIGTLDTVRVGGVVLTRLPSVAGPSTIGGAVLRRFTCIFDYRGHKLILEPNRHVGDTFSRGLRQSSGMSLYASSHRAQPTVNEVTPGMPAARAGLERGDVIVAVDGVPASHLGVERLAEMFDRSGERYRVAVQRGPAVITLDLVP
ncbi:MAG TPA: PDZ domain-containing protein [Longimicrobium sp.]|jgi:hypothetical protein|uniref:PDZ domain-containing protein n=1 Tax=Longimicrobium sp. TaxID=2029185 RepID=UPI002EDA7D93